MASFIKKFGSSVILFLVLIGLFAPISMAQGNGLFDTLDTIKAKVGEGNQAISIIDFSRGGDWGGLSVDLIQVAKDAGYAKLDDLFDPAITLDKVISKITSATSAKRDELTKGMIDSDKEKAIAQMATSILSTAKIKQWGTLPAATQAVLSNDGYDSLGAIIDLYSKGTERDLVKFISDPANKLDGLVENGVPNENGKRLISEIAYQGESQLQSVILAVAQVFRNLMGALAVVFIIVSGILMVFAQGDETKIAEQKRSITYAIIGLAIILIIERLIAAVYGVPGEMRALTKETATMVDVEIYGLVSYLKAILGSVAIFLIVISGIRTIASQGEEAAITNQRKAILWTIVGLVLIVINQVLVENIFIKPVRESADKIQTSNVDAILGVFGRVTQFILGFVGLVAFAALVYGSATMVTNFGNEEAVDKAKKIIKNALIGIVIILSAFAIVSTMIL